MTVDLTGLLLGGPKLSDDAFQALAAVEAERKADCGRTAARPASRDQNGESLASSPGPTCPARAR
jgi:hypothetical protein